jgi:hypothetical protein
MDRPHDPNTMYRAGNTYRGVISLNQLAEYRDGVRDGGVELMHQDEKLVEMDDRRPRRVGVRNNPYAESLPDVRMSIFLVTVKEDRRR